MNKVKLILLAGSLSLLTACQPPPSGEHAGLAYPYLYYQLQQQKLSETLPVPVEGVKPRQIADTPRTSGNRGNFLRAITLINIKFFDSLVSHSYK